MLGKYHENSAMVKQTSILTLRKSLLKFKKLTLKSLHMWLGKGKGSKCIKC